MLANTEFRPDVQGLRALAMGAVALFHASVPGFSGGYVGVDIFFVISGFLITGLLVREVEATGKVDFLAFYARRIRRLLPAASLVFAVTGVAAYVLLSPLEQRELIRSFLASALYLSNFWFASQATDYLAGEHHLDPFLHTWSLGVEEQFYLVWPLVILLAVRLGTPGRARERLAMAMTLVFAASFGLSLWLMQKAQPWAFFASPARAWEFCAGGLAYLAAGRMARVQGAARSVLLGCGLAMMLVPVFVFDATTRFPGTAALIPVAGATLAILAGSGGRVRQSVLIANRPAQLLGNVSYSWYLWHWPLMVFPVILHGLPGLAERLLWMLASLVLAFLTYYLLENRVRFSAMVARTPVRGIALGGLLTLSVLTGGVTLRAAAAGALATQPQAEYLAARTALPSIYRDGCHLRYEDVAFPECVYGDRAASRTIVLYGDSHAAHWFPALERFALESGWRLISLTKSACPATGVPLVTSALARPYTECDAWRERVLQRISSERPALVVMGSSTAYFQDPQQQVSARTWRESLDRALGRIQASGAIPLVLQDTPVPRFDVPACLSRALWLDTGSSCRFVRNTPDVEIAAAYRAAVSQHPGAVLMDFSDLLCDGRVCGALIGGLVAYRDDNHLTLEMSRALAPAIGRRLQTLLPEPDRSHVQPAGSGQRGDRSEPDPFAGNPEPVHRSFG
jgi:peptidoglycan/LPS O-acetylase OafA/YrhL